MGLASGGFSVCVASGLACSNGVVGEWWWLMVRVANKGTQ